MKSAPRKAATTQNCLPASLPAHMSFWPGAGRESATAWRNTMAILQATSSDCSLKARMPAFSSTRPAAIVCNGSRRQKGAGGFIPPPLPLLCCRERETAGKRRSADILTEAPKKSITLARADPKAISRSNGSGGQAPAVSIETNMRTPPASSTCRQA